MSTEEAKTSAQIEQPWFLDALVDRLGGILLAPIDRAFQVETTEFKSKPLATLPYNGAAALAYASSYCSKKTNTPCGQHFDSDCAHFMSHCLAAGGVGVTGGDPAARCSAGLCIRAEELAAAFYNASKQFSNVLQLNGYEQGVRGDYGFLRRLIEKSHAFLLAGTPNATAGPVYAHTAPHCGDLMDTIRIYFGAYYRIS